MQNINDFKKQSLKLFTDKIIYELQPFEEQRIEAYKKYKKALVIFLLFLVFIIIFLICMFIVKVPKEYEPFFSIFLAATEAVALYYLGQIFLISKDFERNLKKQIMTLVFKNVPNFKWQEKSDISNYMIEKFRLFDFDLQSRNDDDCFKGKYKDIDIDICETALRITFRGILICLSLKDKNYKGLTLIKQDNLFTTIDKPLKSYIKNNDLKLVKLEDVEFDKIFNVSSSDQIEARYILTTSFMERLKNLKTVFKADKVEASFCSNYVLIALHTWKDLFKLGNVTKPVYNFNQYKTMIDEFASIFELIDELKFTDNIGL